MLNKTLLSSLLFITTSPSIMANPIYQTETPTKTHHEASIGGVGLLVGSLAAGPFGAIIGGSLGVFAGHQQSQDETITEQQHFITELEHDLEIINTELSQSKSSLSQLESNQKQLEDEFEQAQKNYDNSIQEHISSYQFDIYFLSYSETIHSQAQQGLSKLAVLLKNNPNIQANIEAHSDWRGSDEANYHVAQKRLDSITNELALNGVDAHQLLATNYGEDTSVNQGSWGEELVYDRRVTITLTDF